MIDGEERIFTPAGGLASLATYVAGLRQGVAEIYGPEGGVMRREYYVDDLLDGLVEDFDASGQSVSQIHYKAGVKLSEGAKVKAVRQNGDEGVDPPQASTSFRDFYDALS